MIVVGGSLGGCAALGEILRRLPPDFPQPIAAVLHRQKESDGLLLPALRKGCPLPVTEAEDKEPIRAGQVYLAPPDYHLMIDRDCFALSTDELVNFARPSVDVLFESAAEWLHRSVIAVILTGAGADGAAGARAVERGGGLVLAQDPAAAEGPWMPAAAISATKSARVIPLPAIAEALVEAADRVKRG